CCVQVDRTAGKGPVQVHHVEPAGPFRLPAPGGRYGITVLERLIGIPLQQADGPPLPQVDGGNDLHAPDQLLPCCKLDGVSVPQGSLGGRNGASFNCRRLPQGQAQGLVGGLQNVVGVAACQHVDVQGQAAAPGQAPQPLGQHVGMEAAGRPVGQGLAVDLGVGAAGDV